MDKKYIKSIVIIAILVACLGSIYYIIYNKDKNSQANGGASVSGYILEDGAEPGLTDDEIRELLQKQVDESSISFSISSDPMLFIVEPHITGIISPLCIPIIIPF